ncbi:MAG: hypothetical protein WCG27_01825 [Pseudomonadota bacterium]
MKRSILLFFLCSLWGPCFAQTEIFVGFMTPSQKGVCLGKKLQIEYYFIYGVKEWIHRSGLDPLAPLTNGTAKIAAELGKVTPNLRTHPPIDFTLGGSARGTVSYKAQQAGYEKITVTVQIGNDVGKASFEFQVKRCNYKATWTTVRHLKFGKEIILNVQSGDADFTQNDSGTIEGKGREYFQTNIVETGEPGVVETKNRQGEGGFTGQGTTSEDGQVNIDLSLDSYPVSESVLTAPGGGGGAPGYTTRAGTGKISFPAGEGGVYQLEINRSRPYTQAVTIIPRSE